MPKRILVLFIAVFQLNTIRTWAVEPTPPVTLETVEVTASPYDLPPLPILQVDDLKFATCKQARSLLKAKADVEKCFKASASAGKLCFAKTSPAIQTGMAGIGGILALMKATDSQKESCKKFSSAMDILNTALTAFNAACGAAQLACQFSCKNLAASTTQLQTELTSIASASGGLLCPSINLDLSDAQKTLTAAQAEEKRCGSYVANLAAATAGLYSVLKSSKQSSNCENTTTVDGGVDCKLKPTDPSCTQKPLDCSVAANRTTTECICRANPIARGCPGASDPSNNRNNVRGNNVIGGPNDNGSIGGPDLTGGSGDTTAGGRDLPKSGADSSGAGGGMGAFGGGGGGGGLGLSGTGGKQGGQAAGKKLNANILSGYDGGGGGGGGRGYGGDGADPDSQMRKFLPGGANDPKRGLAGARADGVTGAGGLTNWQKVKNRYGDNKNSLLGGGP